MSSSSKCSTTGGGDGDSTVVGSDSSIGDSLGNLQTLQKPTVRTKRKQEQNGFSSYNEYIPLYIFLFIPLKIRGIYFFLIYKND